MMLWIWQAATDATVASAANAASQQWTYEQWRDLILAVIGAMWLGFNTWQNRTIIKQNVVHEENAEERAEMRGDPKPARRKPFPGKKR